MRFEKGIFVGVGLSSVFVAAATDHIQGLRYASILWKALMDAQTLIGVVVAGVVGAAAYRAAMRQAIVPLEVAEKAALDERRAIASALFAELTGCLVQLKNQEAHLQMTPPTNLVSHLKLRVITTPVYDSAAQKIGSLDPDLVVAVVTAYRMIAAAQRRQADLMARSDGVLLPGEQDRVLVVTKRLRSSVLVAAKKLGESAGHSPELVSRYLRTRS